MREALEPHPIKVNQKPGDANKKCENDLFLLRSLAGALGAWGHLQKNKDHERRALVVLNDHIAVRSSAFSACDGRQPSH